ncbi:hypothetical protein EHI8A_052650 [Entamoeba histolytica HM-1:IMSS-B]|uniref:Uncharacterized protein n=4 Tax=Entamoeba histolytica TaxID=5759 RepID=C4LWC9_ENTH1|nr:hypothetical protein EHI_096160 [Entamoeba histolytica HM-1:IMSS]EAL51604.1 hypothetical protein EHI_096160 [Entamoeba histolytica HM-1:IMSS]EMH74186.1 hypothetical protein EHI8A_052650 [Entamoeba histolytica HM-1:IMSS-B]ENY64366.1 hypothetical protein EHI7A_001660 [Entamoeba histolytica HM-1:IMSS-A]GAT93013.1 hypothetical protein CL6EHI_096160 [Entamoeba histolytica]|eukprot:XP_656990.1 hypothetical protein EHI_096160 [Entamoeba histolytica HM-1:IMSS]
MSRLYKSSLAKFLAKIHQLPITNCESMTVPSSPLRKKTKELLKETFSVDEINELMEMVKFSHQPKRLLDEMEIEKIKEARKISKEDKLGCKVQSSHCNLFNEDISKQEKHCVRSSLKCKQKDLLKSSITEIKKTKESAPHVHH